MTFSARIAIKRTQSRSLHQINLVKAELGGDRGILPASASSESLIRRCSSNEREPLPSSKVQILKRATPDRRASLLCETPIERRLALSRSAAVVELPVTILIVPAANVGDQPWRVGDFRRQRWRFWKRYAELKGRCELEGESAARSS